MAPNPLQTSNIVRVGILEDHQSIIDGYRYRLGLNHSIEVVGVAWTGDELTTLLASTPMDVLIMDVGVPTAANNPNQFPILHVLPRLDETYPGLSVLIISMIAERVLIRALLEAGAHGYILKDESGIIEDQLGSIVLSLAAGGNFVSPRVFDLLNKGRNTPDDIQLTPRQIEALSLCVANPNWSRLQLADALGVTHSTARNLLSTAYLRLGVNTLPAAIAKAQAAGLLPTPPAYKPGGYSLSP
jgi:two-component system, NarL family, nitrate/nitrite response regulator NarL